MDKQTNKQTKSICTGFVGSVSQGNVYILSSPLRGVPSNLRNIDLPKEKHTVGYLCTCYSTELHISVMQEHSEFFSAILKYKSALRKKRGGGHAFIYNSV